jgi:hypothetical protein
MRQRSVKSKMPVSAGRTTGRLPCQPIHENSPDDGGLASARQLASGAGRPAIVHAQSTRGGAGA